MNIFYDHQAFSLQDYGGITRIFSELADRIQQKGHTVSLPLLYSKNVHLQEKNIRTKYHFSALGKSRKILYMLNERYNIREIKKGNFDLYHPTFYNPSLTRYLKKKPFVITFHDMINEKLAARFPELAADKTLIEHKQDIAHQADRIIAVSANTKKDVMELYGISESKIEVIHLGNSFSAGNGETGVTPPGSYLLYVGNRGLYKNFMPFLQAIAPTLKRNKVFLVCAGGRPFGEEESAVINKLKVAGRVLQYPVNDNVLRSLYSNAIAFAFPSFYEGFGIPVLEAFACNCPCILSETSSLPEVAGDAAIYMNPDNAESMNAAVETILSDAALRQALVSRGNERLRDYSWDKHTEQTLSVYKQLCQ